MTGGITYGRLTVHRSAVPPDRVPGFDQPDARRISADGPALRGGVPRPDGGVADGWETPDCAPVYRVPKLPPADAGRSAVLHPHLPQDLCTAGGPRTLVRDGPGQSESVDPRPLACLAHGPPHPRRCPSPFSDGLGAALRCLRGRRGHRGHAAGGRGANARRRRTTRTTSVPPFAHDGTERRIVRPQDPPQQAACYSGKNKDHTVNNVLLVNALLVILVLSATY